MNESSIRKTLTAVGDRLEASTRLVSACWGVRTNRLSDGESRAVGLSDVWVRPSVMRCVLTNRISQYGDSGRFGFQQNDAIVTGVRRSRRKSIVAMACKGGCCYVRRSFGIV